MSKVSNKKNRRIIQAFSTSKNLTKTNDIEIKQDDDGGLRIMLFDSEFIENINNIATEIAKRKEKEKEKKSERSFREKLYHLITD